MTAKIDFAELAKPEIAWTKVALCGPWLIFPGIWGAILSSAFGSILSGPRVLQALAKDGLAPRFFARLSSSGQPLIATWATGLVSLAALFLGALNTVAQFVTILFLTLYLIINLSAAVEQLVGEPSYRPSIRVPWYLSLIGAAGVILVMFLLNPWWCLAAITLEICIYLTLRSRSLKVRWGDVRAGFWTALARFALLRLRTCRPDPRNWRPHILLFAGDTSKRLGLVRLANWFNQNRGILTVYQLIEGNLEKERPNLEAKLAEMEEVFVREGLVAFSQINVASSYENEVIDISQSHGIAGLQPNTVMFGWSRKQGRLAMMLRVMRANSRIGKSTVIARLNWGHEPGKRKRIDIWWRGLQRNGDLMLLFAHLLVQNPEWQDAVIVVRSIVDQEETRESMDAGLKTLVGKVRINAETEVLVKPPQVEAKELIFQASQDADLVFMGLTEPEVGKEEKAAQRIMELAEGLNTTVFVHNAGRFAGQLL